MSEKTINFGDKKIRQNDKMETKCCLQQHQFYRIQSFCISCRSNNLK